MDLSMVLQFWVVAALLAVTPGADWAYAIAAGLRARSVVPSILGMLFGYVVVVVIVAVGLGALIAQFPAALTGLTVLGASYLIYLGVTTLLARVDHLSASEEDIGQSVRSRFFKGAGISGINPKGLLLLLALLPQFTTTDGWPSIVQMLILGSLHVANCAVVYFSVSLGARRILKSRPQAAVIVTRLSGIVMTLIGLGILIEKAIELLH